MRREHLSLLACPACRGGLQLSVRVVQADGRVVSGELRCDGCAASYPIEAGVPRFVPRENYASGFGLEWTRHARTLYDSYSGIPASRSRFFGQTHWPESLAGELLLEVGSGSGRFTEQAAATGATVISLDYSYAVDANYAANGARDNVLIVQADVFAMPLRSRSFDRIFCFGMLQHTPSPARAFAALPQFLKPDGYLCADMYKVGLFRTLLQTKYWVRPITSRMRPDKLYALVRRWVDFMWPVAAQIRKLPKGFHINWRLLVADYSFLGLEGQMLKEWAYLDTFDMLAPRYDRPATLATFRRWALAAGLDRVEAEYTLHGVVLRARTPMTATVPRARLLIVGAFPPSRRAVYGGMVTSCRALLRSSLPQRLELALIDTTQSAHPPPPAPLRTWRALRRMASYFGAFESRRPDAVMLFVAAGMSVADKGAMAWYARARGVPVLLFPRGGPVLEACRRSRVARVWVRLAFGGARMILCQGPAWRRFALDTLRFAPEAAPVIPNWTASPELLELGRTRAAAGAVPRVLFVGWLDREKGIAELLSACRELATQRRFTLHLAGEGNLSVVARRYVAAHGLSERVEFCGWLGEQELRTQYARADIFVLPSWSEGLPNAMIEAMAAGLAVIATAVGNVPDTLQNEASALLIAPREPRALQLALERLIDDAPLRRVLGQAAHGIAASEFGVEPAVDRIVAAVTQARALHGSSRALHRSEPG